MLNDVFCKEKDFLDLSLTHNLKDGDYESFIYLAKCLSYISNIPMIFWCNSIHNTEDVHYGFFLLRTDFFKNIIEYIVSGKLSNIDGVDFTEYALKLFNYLSEYDPNELYELYKF